MDPKSIAVAFAASGDSIVFTFTCTTPKGHTFAVSRGEPVASMAALSMQQMCDNAYAGVSAAIRAKVVELDNAWGAGGATYVPPSGKIASTLTPIVATVIPPA